MADTFRFDLVSPERVLVSEDVSEVIVPSNEGDFGMLPNHAPIIASLRPGALTVRGSGSERKYFVRGGLAEGGPEQLTVLAQRAMPLEELDPEKIAQEIQWAKEDVEDARDEETRAQAVDNLERLETLAEVLKQNA
ncbi:F0F1 ATP synthase subunit epsilon [Dichotomicrobium thermohalophilum]|uniref:ATP synthase epsilon chain n=1 Tax=Dichotomicrobium thermohalophilum TaxID=933063 RepID=A0A397PFB9_9HYPH|nr:F0F1 ATP synthase subunit epsilon [Dichotomicrobium thermohalophilum]RIA47712.1 ATP synthase F1 subcomplex epsilon subunit [Dichotomicrobium thermohalophilum]